MKKLNNFYLVLCICILMTFGLWGHRAMIYFIDAIETLHWGSAFICFLYLTIIIFCVFYTLITFFNKTKRK
jgi:hypothetical protein